ncbi:PLAC8 family-domain-containing protein [Infundibulicybe gibba]|nr:PLAC8 family-domain-containing protein [Infundibulicybe gibba]
MSSKQPEPTNEMSITPGGNKNVKNLPIDNDGREWSNELCSCCDDAGTCVLATCCPCIVYGQIKQRLDHLDHSGTPDPDRGGVFTGDCCIHAIVGYCGLGFVLQCFARSSVRSRYHIRGGTASDCGTAFCCGPCALVQAHREIELEEHSFGQGAPKA